MNIPPLVVFPRWADTAGSVRRCGGKELFPLPTISHHAVLFPRQPSRSVTAIVTTGRKGGGIIGRAGRGLGAAGPCPLGWGGRGKHNWFRKGGKHSKKHSKKHITESRLGIDSVPQTRH